MFEPGPGVAFGRYRMTGAPTYHGAGSVIEAVEARTGQPRTLWLVMPHIVNEPAQRDEVIRVARLLRRLESDHLVRLYEFGEIDGQPFFATGSVAGVVDLARVVEPDGIPPVDAIDLIAQVGTGISHLHHAGLVDGALGPHRVLVEERDGRITATVRDAGILNVLLGTSALFGTLKQEALDFGAPELHHGGEPTTRADVYSLGCLLWLTMTGETPFTSYVGHRAEEVPQVAGEGPIEEAVNAVLRTALAKDPGQRYRDVGAFVGTLKAIAGLAHDGAVGPLPDRFVPLVGVADRDVEDEWPEIVLPESGRESGPEAGPETRAPEAPELASPADNQPDADGTDADGTDADEPALAKARAAFDAREHAALNTSSSERSALAEVAAGWAPIDSLRPADAPVSEPSADGREALATASADEDASVEPAMVTAIDHWAAGRAVSRMRNGRSGKRGAARALSVAAVLGTVAVVTVWGVRHFQPLETKHADADASASSRPDSSPAGNGVPSADATKSLARLFPIVGKDDCDEDTAKVAHRLERWTCERTGYRVVLTHWDSQQHARELVAHEGRGETWSLHGEHAGTQWTWRGKASSERPFRWTAAYADVPYAVIIEARSPARRDYGRTHVVFQPSTALG
jgi:hypothetical protein